MPLPLFEMAQVTIPLKPCSLPNVIVEIPTPSAIPVIGRPIPKSFRIPSTVSLVILFFWSFVSTDPTGDLLANVLADSGFSFRLSLSSCG